ncbi:Uncharacterized protein GBIM_04739 [Gryllus bimaculatus]|nr:Uncharacterized protein GBIM_04739 [Gryllus bimaculatus]
MKGDVLQGPDDLCLGCICEATTNCNLTFGCSRGLCGPFLISQPYWKDAGEPTLQGDSPQREGAYLRCVRDPYCAAATVRQYMNKFAQDCNVNGHVECDDFARIHYLGGYQCNLPMESLLYYQVFRQCLNSVQQLNG